MAHVCLSVCPAWILIWTNPNRRCDMHPQLWARVVVLRETWFWCWHWGLVGDFRVPRAAWGRFLHDLTESHIWLPNAYFYTVKIFDPIVGRSATPACLGSSRIDFSENQQISYLVPKMPIFAEKNFCPYSRSTTKACLRSPQTDFSKYHLIAIWAPKGLFLHKKYFHYYSRAVDEFWIPRVT